MFAFNLPSDSTTLYAVIALLVCFVIAVCVKLFDQWRDSRQKEYQEIGDKMGLFGQDVIGEYFKALARDGYEEAGSIRRAVLARLKKPGGVEEVLATMIIKALKDADFMSNPDVKARLQPVIAERVLGLLFTPQLRQEFATLGPVLREYGSTSFADLVVALGLENYDGAKAAGQQLVSLLRNTEQLDDELVKRAIKGIPRAIHADPRHWTTLNDVIQAAKPVAAVPTA